MRSIKLIAGLAAALMLVLALAPIALAANGTITGTVKGPHGESVAGVTYNFTNKTSGAVTSGTTDSSGVFTQVLDASAQYSFSVTPDTTKDGFQYSDAVSIPYVGIPPSGTLNMGNVYFPMKAGEHDADVDKQGMTPPSQCSSTPQAGGPVINKVDFVDAPHGSFMYTGRNVGVIVYASKVGLTVTADFSLPEGQQPGNGSYVVVATDNGDGTYTANHTLVNTSRGGGMVIVRATDSSNGLVMTGCSQPGPVNLDIRNQVPPDPKDGTTPYLTSSDTTDFTKVADFRALKNFTMAQTGVFKVVITKTVNMLDPTVQNFMKGLFKKLHSITTGVFGLDAKAVLELKNAGASITLYNVPDYISTPTVLLDGGDAGSAVSGITYDRTAHSITFAAAHFSTYSVVPTLTVTAPTDKTTTSDTTVTVKGTVNDVTSTVTISVGGTDQGSVTVNSDGSFSKAVNVAMGDNTIKINASNSVGAGLEVDRVVTRQALPATGVGTNVILILAVLLMAGVGVLAVAKRRGNA